MDDSKNLSGGSNDGYDWGSITPKIGGKIIGQQNESGTADACPPSVFIMPIERILDIDGHGTVAYGRIECGEIKVGDVVKTRGGTKPSVEVTVDFNSIERELRLVDRAKAGENIGCLLRGVSSDDIEIGQILTKSAFSMTVEEVFKEDGFTCVSGLVECGLIMVGDVVKTIGGTKPSIEMTVGYVVTAGMSEPPPVPVAGEGECAVCLFKDINPEDLEIGQKITNVSKVSPKV